MINNDANQFVILYWIDMENRLLIAHINDRGKNTISDTISNAKNENSIILVICIG
jgi:predicted DNA binding protein